jgi:CRISPR/Cas system CMR-associated protein Cmr1 (group 7 of RAMP superfamily)
MWLDRILLSTKKAFARFRKGFGSICLTRTQVINDTKTLELMENFVEAEELAQNSFEQVHEQQEAKALVEEDFCIA